MQCQALVTKVGANMRQITEAHAQLVSKLNNVSESKGDQKPEGREGYCVCVCVYV